MTDPGRFRPPAVTRGAILRFTLGLAFAGVLIGWGLPHVAGTTWTHILAELAKVSVPWLLLLAALSVASLSSYAVTLAASLPGLSAPRALLVNVCGSAVSKIFPGGGAVGLAATVGIFRSWGYSVSAISTSAIITMVWNTVSRVALPVVALGWLYLAAYELPASMHQAALWGALSGATVIGLFAGSLASGAMAARLGRAVDWAAARLPRRPQLDAEAKVGQLRSSILSVVRWRWGRLTLGMVGYLGWQYVMFLVVLQVTGVHVDTEATFAAFAIGRLLSAVGITPGGLGIAEGGTVAALVLLGAAQAPAAAAVLLFSLFTNLIDIPFGGVGWLVYLASRRASPDNGAPSPGTEVG